MLSFWLNSLVNFRQKKRNLDLSNQPCAESENNLFSLKS